MSKKAVKTWTSNGTGPIEPFTVTTSTTVTINGQTINTNTAMMPERIIESFSELMDLIAYDWGFDTRGGNLKKEEDGRYWINKTTITPTEVTYKTDRYKITNPLIYKKLEKFYELLQEEKMEKVLYK